jgi:hypothetical protein
MLPNIAGPLIILAFAIGHAWVAIHYFQGTPRYLMLTAAGILSVVPAWMAYSLFTAAEPPRSRVRGIPLAVALIAVGIVFAVFLGLP